MLLSVSELPHMQGLGSLCSVWEAEWTLDPVPVHQKDDGHVLMSLDCWRELHLHTVIIVHVFTVCTFSFFWSDSVEQTLIPLPHLQSVPPKSPARLEVDPQYKWFLRCKVDGLHSSALNYWSYGYGSFQHQVKSLKHSAFTQTIFHLCVWNQEVSIMTRAQFKAQLEIPESLIQRDSIRGTNNHSNKLLGVTSWTRFPQHCCLLRVWSAGKLFFVRTGQKCFLSSFMAADV